MTRSNTIEELEDSLKVTLPIERNWGILILFSFTLIVWLGMLIFILTYLIGRTSSSIIQTAILIIWVLVWLWFGRFLWNRWQYFAANREILFVDQGQVIIRRPVSILGHTTTYDRQHVSEFYISERHQCPTFDYAYLHVYFGQSLAMEEAEVLVRELNLKLFWDDKNDADAGN
jgi:hypothetical protein